MFTLQDIQSEVFDKISQDIQIAEAYRNGLSIQASEPDKIAPFYGDNRKPLWNDESLLADAKHKAEEFQVLLASRGKDEFFPSEPTEMRMQLESGLAWRARREDGEGVSLHKAAVGENLLRSLKMRYVTIRAQTVLGQAPRAPNPVQITRENSLFLVWPISSKEIVSLQISDSGRQRCLEAFRLTQTGWKRVGNIGELEFPVKEMARQRNKRGKWKFRLMPMTPIVVSCLRSKEHRDFIDEMHLGLFERIKRDYLAQKEEETSCTYIETEPVGYQPMQVLEASEERGLKSELEAPSYISRRKLVDKKWSEAICRKIFERMDPNGAGVATKPMSFQAIELKKEGWVPIKHRNVQESLFWLLGGRKKGNGTRAKGFVSHSMLTHEIRDMLWNFGRASWKHLKEEKAQKQKDLSEKLNQEMQKKLYKIDVKDTSGLIELITQQAV